MKVNKVITWILIFALIMPTVILISTGTAYAFGGIDLDNNFLNVLKAFLALFFLGKVAGEKESPSDSLEDPINDSIKQENMDLGNTSDIDLPPKEGDNNQTSPKQVETDEEKYRTTKENSEINETDQIPQTDKPNIQTEDKVVEIIEKKDWTDLEVNSLTRDEELMLEMLNSERIKAGLNPLKIDFKLTQVARAKSRDMINNDYFSHFSPTYGSPFDMMKKLNIDYYLAGENIAGAPKVEWAHNELMKSKGHRENILHPDYTHVGIGIINGGPYGKMFSQEFADLD